MGTRAENVESARKRGVAAIVMVVVGWGLMALGASTLPPEVSIVGALLLLAAAVLGLLAVLALLRKSDPPVA